MEILGLILLSVFFILQSKEMFSEKKKALANSNKSEDNTNLQYQKKIEEVCVKLLHPHAKVLQFGYSFGHASELITSFKFNELVIIEPIKEVFQKAKKWAKDNNSIKVFNSNIEKELPYLNNFNSIYLDCFNIKSYGGQRDFYKTINTRKLSIIIE